MVFQKLVVVDTRGHLLGRLASLIAKELLMGQHVVCVRCEEINISGTFIRNKRKSPRPALCACSGCCGGARGRGTAVCCAVGPHLAGGAASLGAGAPRRVAPVALCSPAPGGKPARSRREVGLVTGGGLRSPARGLTGVACSGPQ